MEPVIHFAPYTGWVYPNETVFEWSVLIALYPYLTGLVAEGDSRGAVVDVPVVEPDQAGGGHVDGAILGERGFAKAFEDREFV